MFALKQVREGSILAVGLALVATAVYVDRRDDTPVFSPYREGYSGKEINVLDRLGYTDPAPWAANLADAGLFGGPTLPILLSLHPRTRPHYPVIVLIWLETMLLTFALSSLIKNTVSRPRPYVYNENWELERALTRRDRAAFLSGHAANATAGATLFAGLLTAYGLDRHQLGRLLAGTIAGTTAFLRVRAAKHWPTDAISGILLGGAVAGAMLWAHRGTGN